MKSKILVSLILGCGLTAAAQGGYQDGVDNFNAGRLDVAKVILNNTLNDPTTDKAVSYFYLGSIDMSEGNTQAAQQNFTKGRDANPAYGYNYIGLGEVALKNGDKSTAEKLFKEGMNTDKKNTALLAAVARAYYNVDPVLYKKEIDKYVNKALKDSKNTEPAAYILLGDMQAAEDPGAAAGQYEMAIQMDKNVNREAYVKYANTYFRVNPKYAINKLEELNQLEPNSALAQRELAEKYYDNNQFGSACIQYGKYLQNPNHFQSDEQRYAGLLYSAKEYQKSIDIANQVLANDPNNPYMYRVLLLNYSDEEAPVKDYNKAVSAAEKLFNNPDAKLVPNDYICYANALTGLQRYDDAVAIYQKAVELNPDKPELLLQLSGAYDKAGDPAKAVDVMKQYLDGGNGSTNDLVSMARRYQSLARSCAEESPEREQAMAEGIKYINMALERVPDNGMCYYIKASLYLTGQGVSPDAANAYLKMLECFDVDPANKAKYQSLYAAAYFVLGGYYLSLGDNDKAVNYYTQYVDTAANPDPSVLQFLGRTPAE